MAGRDITEGDDNVWALAPDGLPIARAIMDVGVATSTAIWQNTDVSYDVAVGGQPFIYAINDNRPYVRQTAPFKKEQFDNQAEPGEQSLTGWWIRSQSSFHAGSGIKFYDPSSGEAVAHRFADSENVNIWTKGQVTLLKKANTIGYPAAALESSGHTSHYTNSIKWTLSTVNYEGILDGGDYNIVRISTDGTIYPLVTTTDRIITMTTDGVYVYWISNREATGVKMHMYRKLLDSAVADAATLPTPMFIENIVAVNATLNYTKARLVAGINTSTFSRVYEILPTATALPTQLYAYPNPQHTWTSIASGGTAIYIAGFNGGTSSILKFVLTTSTGNMPALNAGITAAELPAGEVVFSMMSYLGYLMIGTNKGIRVASIDDGTNGNGNISYGPLIVETRQPVHGFAGRDRFVWCASGTTGGKQGLIRIDLGNEIESLRFSYANDLQANSFIEGGQVVSVGHFGNTDRLFFSTTSALGTQNKSVTNKALINNIATLTTSVAHGLLPNDVIYIKDVGSPFDSGTSYPVGSHRTILTTPTATTFTIALTGTDVASTAAPAGAIVFLAGNAVAESATELATNGYINTGNIRYNTLEPKNFKRLLGRGDFKYGSMTLYTIKNDGTLYDHISYDAAIGAPEVNTLEPEGQQEYLSYRFELFRDATTNSRGPVFTGYQAKATIATPRQRVMQFPVFCYDVETDRYNSLIGYEGRALERLRTLENIEANGDVVNWQDITTGENRQVVIEQISFTRMTPPDKRFDGFGGVIQITVRTV